MAEEISNNENLEGGSEKFPIGMRVLAVDDDPLCLAVLEKFLTICEYNVTATNEARKALEILRENKDGFDIVISDVSMPDMDGFKLLELVGLEMDLPVIMLSANGETETVMKGISHGACDYLVKPVRIEELKVIWKHVVMKKKSSKNQSNNNNNNGANGDDNTNVNINNNKRRNEEDEEEEERDSDETGAQKKPRVVWSGELHRKFVEAVNELGIDKAVPKKILEKMNESGLTRENVASHLQKYRLYLKRLKGVATQQPGGNFQTGFGSRSNPQFTQLSPLESFRNYHQFGRYKQYVPAVPTVPASPFPYQSTGFGNTRLTLPPTMPITGNTTSNNGIMVNNNGILGNNNGINNTGNMFMGVAGTSTSTYSFSYLNNGINYPSLPVGQITNMPSVGTNVSPYVIGGTNGNGENGSGGNGDELQQVISSFNTPRSVSALFNPIMNMNTNININMNMNGNVGGSNVPVVGTNNGEMSFCTGTGTGTGTSTVVDQHSSNSNNGGDNSGLNNVDDLLTAILKPVDVGDNLSFVDDMFAN